MTQCTNKQIDEACELYTAGFTCIEVGKYMNCHFATVARWVRERGLTRSMKVARRRDFLREDAFSVLTPESSYWIGFLLADGCVRKSALTAAPTITLGLQLRDLSHLEAFKQFLNSRCAITIRKRGQWSFASLNVYSDRLANDLSSYGVVPAKSLIAEAKNGVEKSRDFWRGVIDGDGTLGIYNRPSMPLPVASIGLVSASRKLTEQFVEFLRGSGLGGTCRVAEKRCTHEACKIGDQTFVAKRSMFSVQIGAGTAIDVISYLYSDAVVALSRKARLASRVMQLAAAGTVCGSRERHSMRSHDGDSKTGENV